MNSSNRHAKQAKNSVKDNGDPSLHFPLNADKPPSFLPWRAIWGTPFPSKTYRIMLPFFFKCFMQQEANDAFHSSYIQFSPFILSFSTYNAKKGTLWTPPSRIGSLQEFALLMDIKGAKTEGIGCLHMQESRNLHPWPGDRMPFWQYSLYNSD